MSVMAQTFYFFFEFYLDGVPDPVIYEASAEDVERLQYVLHQLEYDPEEEAVSEYEYFYFITPDRRHVVVHLSDIQAARILVERRVHEIRHRNPYWVPKVTAYIRGRPAPIVETLEGEAEDHYNLLSPEFFDAASGNEISFLPKMLSYLNGEGDRCVLSRRHLMMWVVDWEYRVSLTTVFEADGLFRAGHTDEKNGVWRIHVWRLRDSLFTEEQPSLEWYANVEFWPVDHPGEEVLYEFDTYGPYPTKSEAITAAETDFESGRYFHRITQLRQPGSLDEEEY